MNILPKKRWHVRTRENIARVRRDEAKAAEEEKRKQLRAEVADREARTELLRKKAREQYGTAKLFKEEPTSSDKSDKHVNLFHEVEHDSFVSDKTNAEYEKEKKLEREKYEKQIGYLTYLGQDTNEITGNVSWYNRNPEERRNVTEEVAKDSKFLEDPLRDIRKYLGSKGIQKITHDPKNKKHKINEHCVNNSAGIDSVAHISLKKKKKKNLKEKKRKKKRKKSYSSDSESSQGKCKKPNFDIEILRAQRLKREMEERKRAEAVLRKLKGEEVEEKVEINTEQKYHSQFNPHLAKQNLFKS